MVGAEAAGDGGELPPALHPRAAGGSARGRQTSDRRVRDLVRAAIGEDLYDEGEHLDEEVLVAAMATSRSAVRRALQQLTEEGLLRRRQRLGTYPQNRTLRLKVDDIAGSDPAGFRLKITDHRLVPSTPLLRALLGIEDAEMHMMENTFSHDGGPIGVRTAYFPVSFPAVNYDGPVEMVGIGRTVFGTDELKVLSTEVGATLADSTTARLLAMSPGGAIVTRRQVFVDGDGNRLQVVFDHYRADRVSFAM